MEQLSPCTTTIEPVKVLEPQLLKLRALWSLWSTRETTAMRSLRTATRESSRKATKIQHSTPCPHPRKKSVSSISWWVEGGFLQGLSWELPYFLDHLLACGYWVRIPHFLFSCLLTFFLTGTVSSLCSSSAPAVCKGRGAKTGAPSGRVRHKTVYHEDKVVPQQAWGMGRGQTRSGKGMRPSRAALYGSLGCALCKGFPSQVVPCAS